MDTCACPLDLARELDESVRTLRDLLEESVACARRGNLLRLEALSEQADAIVEKMKQRYDDLPAALAPQGPDLQRLYAELVSMLRAEQADTHDRLKHLRQMRRAVGVYRTDR